MIILDSDVNNTKKVAFQKVNVNSNVNLDIILWLSSLIQHILEFCEEYVSNLCITFLLKVIVHPKMYILTSFQMFMTFFLQMNTRKYF